MHAAAICNVPDFQPSDADALLDFEVYCAVHVDVVSVQGEMDLTSSRRTLDYWYRDFEHLQPTNRELDASLRKLGCGKIQLVQNSPNSVATRYKIPLRGDCPCAACRWGQN